MRMGRRYYDDYYYDYNPERRKAMEKNEKLVDKYLDVKDDLCHGVGQNKIKRFLNKKVKEGDKVAELYRVALELENNNINAKRYGYRYKYRERYYRQKEELIAKLTQLCSEYVASGGTLDYGYVSESGHSTSDIVYFDLPAMEQISYHTNLSEKQRKSIPKYGKEWDHKEYSTMPKIENAIEATYGVELDEVYKKDRIKEAVND